ncbi:MAG: RICIN domain-containing protein [Clostridia bacterium]|nr:RICIN domain-containing protein [Clostridia bacterium]
MFSQRFKKTTALVLIISLMLSILPLNAFANTSAPRVTLVPNAALKEDNLNTSSLDVLIDGFYFKSTKLAPEDFAFSNAPLGLYIKRVDYVSPIRCIINLGFEGDIDKNISDMTLRILPSKITLPSAIDSDTKLSVSAINDEETLSASWQLKGSNVDFVYEYQEAMHSILVTIKGGLFADEGKKTLDVSKWRIDNLPKGVAIKSISLLAPDKALITLTGKPEGRLTADAGIRIRLSGSGYSDSDGTEISSGELAIRKGTEPTAQTTGIKALTANGVELTGEMLSEGFPAAYEKGFAVSENSEALKKLGSQSGSLQTGSITMFKGAENTGKSIVSTLPYSQNSLVYYRAYALSDLGSSFGSIKQLKIMSAFSKYLNKATAGFNYTYKKVFANIKFSLDLPIGDDIPDGTSENGFTAVNKNTRDGKTVIEGMFDKPGIVALQVPGAGILFEVLPSPGDSIDTSLIKMEDAKSDPLLSGLPSFDLDDKSLQNIPDEYANLVKKTEIAVESNYSLIDSIKVGFESDINLGFAQSTIKRLDEDTFKGRLRLKGFSGGKTYDVFVNIAKKKQDSGNMFELTADLSNPLSDVKVIRDILKNDICTIGTSAQLIAQFAEKKIDIANTTAADNDKVYIKAPIELKLDPTKDKLKLFALIDLTEFKSSPEIPITFGMEEGYKWEKPFSIIPGEVQTFLLDFVYNTEKEKAENFQSTIKVKVPGIGIVGLDMPKLPAFGMPSFFNVDIPNLPNLLNPLFDLLKAIGLPDFKINIKSIRIPVDFVSLGSLKFKGINFNIDIVDFPKIPNFNLDLNLPELNLQALLDALKFEISLKFLDYLFGLINIKLPDIGNFFEFNLDLIKLKMKRISKQDFEGSLTIKYLKAGSDYVANCTAKLDPEARNMTVTAKMDNPLDLVPVFKPLNSLGLISTEKKLDFKIIFNPSSASERVNAKLSVPFDMKLDPTASMLKMYMDYDMVGKTVKGGLRPGASWKNPFSIIPGKVRELNLESNPQFTDLSIKSIIESDVLGDLDMDVVFKGSGQGLLDNKIKIKAKDVKPGKIISEVVKQVPIPSFIKSVFDEVASSFKVKELSCDANAMDLIQGKSPSFKLVWQIAVYGITMAEQTIKVPSVTLESFIPVLAEALYNFVKDIVTGKIAEVFIKSAVQKAEQFYTSAKGEAEKLYNTVGKDIVNSFNKIKEMFANLIELFNATIKSNYDLYQFEGVFKRSIDEFSAEYIKGISSLTDPLAEDMEKIPDQASKLKVADSVVEKLKAQAEETINKMNFDYVNYFSNHLYLSKEYNIVRDRMNNVKKDRIENLKAWLDFKKESMLIPIPEKKLVYRMTTEYEKVWDNSHISDREYSYSIWYPVPRDGFYPVSLVLNNSFSKPSFATVLVKKDGDIIVPSSKYTDYPSSASYTLNKNGNLDIKFFVAPYDQNAITSATNSKYALYGLLKWSLNTRQQIGGRSFVSIGQNAITASGLKYAANTITNPDDAYWKDTSVGMPAYINRAYVDAGSLKFVAATQKINESKVSEEQFSNTYLFFGPEPSFWSIDSKDGLNAGGVFISPDRGQPQYEIAYTLKKGTYLSESEAAAKSMEYLGKVDSLLADGDLQKAKEFLDIGLYYSNNPGIRNQYARELDFIKSYQEGLRLEKEKEKNNPSLAEASYNSYKKAYDLKNYPYVKTRMDSMAYDAAMYQGRMLLSQARLDESAEAYMKALAIYPDRELAKIQIERIKDMKLRQIELLFRLDEALAKKDEGEIIAAYLEARSVYESDALKAYESKLPSSLKSFLSESRKAYDNISKNNWNKGSWFRTHEPYDILNNAISLMSMNYNRNKLTALKSDYLSLSPGEFLKYLELRKEAFNFFPSNMPNIKLNRYYEWADKLEASISKLREYTDRYPEFEKDLAMPLEQLNILRENARKFDEQLKILDEAKNNLEYYKALKACEELSSRRADMSAETAVFSTLDKNSSNIWASRNPFMEPGVNYQNNIDQYKKAIELTDQLRRSYDVDAIVPNLMKNIAAYKKVMDEFAKNDVSNKNQSVLMSGEYIKATGSLVSPNKKYTLKITQQGPKIFEGTRVVWQLNGKNNSSFNKTYFIMENTGNLSWSIRYYEGRLWSSGTSGAQGAFLRLTNDGSLEVVSSDGKNVLWQSQMIEAGKTYEIQSIKSGKNLTVNKSSTGNNVRIQLWSPSASNRHYTWRLEKVGEGSNGNIYRIVRSDNNSLCLSANENTSSGYMFAEQRNYSNDKLNHWYLDSSIGNMVEIVNEKIRKGLDIQDGLDADGTSLILQKNYGDNRCFWKLVEK